MAFLRVVAPQSAPAVVNALCQMMRGERSDTDLDELLSGLWVNEEQLQARLTWQREEYGD